MKKVFSTLLVFFCLSASLKLGIEIIHEAHRNTLTKNALSLDPSKIKKTDSSTKRNLLKNDPISFTPPENPVSFSLVFEDVLPLQTFSQPTNQNPVYLLRSPPALS